MPKTYHGAYRPVFDEFPYISPLNESRPDLIDTITPNFVKDTLIIDFESRQVSYSRFDTLTGYPLWEFHYSEINDYLTAMERHTRHAVWNKKMIEKGKKKKKTGPALRLQLPAHLPAWATRILGKTPPQLSITGSQSIKIGVESTKQDIDDQPVNDGSKPSVFFLPSSNFKITGTVGRLLKLEIQLNGNKKSNSDEAYFDAVDDQLSNIKIEYRADSSGELEDDIIQEVVVGMTSFDMPGQGLAGYSAGSNDGLFGIKIRSQIGPLSLTTIASVEQVENQKKTIDLAASNRPIEIGESEMQKNLYFYLDEVYRLKYLAKFTDSTAYLQHLAEKGYGTSSPKIKTHSIYKRINGQVKPDNPNKEYVWAKYSLNSSDGGATNT